MGTFNSMGMGHQMGMGGPMGMGMNSMGGMGVGMHGRGGLGNSMMGPMGMGDSGSANEKAFLSALQASGINNAQLTLLLPSNLVQNILVPRGFMAEVAQKSGSKIDLGVENPPGMQQVTLSGAMVGNALASLFLQELVLQFQQMM